MLYQINTVACAALWVIGVVLGLSAAAQAPSPAPPTAVETVETFGLVEPWVRSLAVPPDALGPDVGGASITLRLRGAVVGRGVAIGRGVSTVPDAARLAILDARDELAPANDLNAEERAMLEAGAVTIALELAGAVVPIDAMTYTEMSALISPGTEAIAVGLGRQADAVFPLEMLFTNQQAGSAASRLVAELSGDAMMGSRQPGELVADAGASFFRLRTTAVAQLRPAGPPRVLYRGGRLVELRDIASRDELELLARELAGWLARHEGVGTYLPTNGTTLELAGEATAALRAFALARAVDHLEEAHAEELRTHVETLAPNDPVAGALVGLARHELGMEPEFVPSDPGEVPRVARAIVTYALARTGEEAFARQQLSKLRAVENPSQLVGVMPWLGWAEIELAGEGDIPPAIALRQMRDIVADFQLTTSDAGTENLDLVGGVVFTSGTAPLPTWHTARPIAFLATMLPDPRLTEPDEVAEQLVSVLNAVRFLRQLAASDVEGFMYREPAEAVGGVRAAAWDQRMPADATAMTLLAVLETLGSLDALAEREAQQP